MGDESNPAPDGDAGLGYHSPSAEVLDTVPFYNGGARDGDHQDHTDHHNGHEISPGEQDASHLHADSDPTQQHIPRPANLEELQLAAQLGQGLAGTAIMPSNDNTMNVDEANMRSILPHPDTDGSYVHHDTPTSDHMVQHPMQVPQQLTPQYALSDGIPPRKRSKVSRACDECRRKKIKCDAQSDTGDSPCSSCARSSIRCLFSRVPQKRGPSKGYIKELADRINSIENKLESDGNLTQEEIDRLFGAERHRPTQNGVAVGDDGSRKRPFSSISGADLSTPLSNRAVAWGSEPRSLEPTPAHSEAFPPFHNASLAPAPIPIKADVTPSKPPPVIDAEMTDDEDVPEIDEEEYNDVFASIQTVYPILPSSREKMQSLLAQCPAQIKTAFILALQAVGQTTPGDVKQSSALLHDWESSEEPRSRAADLVHAQTLLFLITDADWRGSATLPFLLARLIALANTMSLWRFSVIEEGMDMDSEEMLCLRVWWAVVLVDRWYAAGTGRPSQVPDSSVVAPAGLENVVGEVCFHYIRLSKLLNRISFVMSTLEPGASTAQQPMADILTDYVENFREDLPAHVDAAAYPLVHLAYWHCKLLVTLLTPNSTAAETLWPAKELANLLMANPDIRSPLTNHFVSLAVMSLIQLAKTESTHKEAIQVIEGIIEQSNSGLWDGVRDKLSDLLRPSSSAGAVSQGLQHLADLATADEGGAAPSLAAGYLEVA